MTQALAEYSDRPTLPVTIVIPTFGRCEVVADTVNQFLVLEPRPDEILVVDQNKETLERVLEHAITDRTGVIRWLRMSPPSQPVALNLALQRASHSIVLFVDDDIQVDPGLVQGHYSAYSSSEVWAVAGQVLQPGQAPVNFAPFTRANGLYRDTDFPFNHDQPEWIENGMSGNLSVRRDRALQVGGFDENFLAPVSYRFDNEFCKRIVRAGGKIRYEPKARVYHLRAPSGGTRSAGNHLTSASPVHGVGDYYFALRQGWSPTTFKYVVRRPWREVMTRFHLAHPWYIPLKFFGELRALALAARLARQGPKLIARQEVER